MNENQNTDEASRQNQEATSEIENTSAIIEENSSQDGDSMKRQAAKRLIERYFYQLTDGCGNPACDNEFCASSGEVKNLTPNQAAAQALQLFSQDAKLCDIHPNKMARTHENLSGPNIISNETCMEPEPKARKGESVKNNMCQKKIWHAYEPNTEETKTDVNVSKTKELKTVSYLTEKRLKDIVETCKNSNCYSLLIRTLGEVYSGIESLSRSFRCEVPSSPIDAMLDKVPGDLSKLKKEDVRSLQGEIDKDQDSSEGLLVGESSFFEICRQPLDVASLRRSYQDLFKLPSEIFESALVNALQTLAGYIQIELQKRSPSSDFTDILDAVIIVFEIQALGTGEYLESGLPALCKALAFLPVVAQAELARRWARPRPLSLRSILENLQQLITLRVIVTQFHRDFFVQDEIVVSSAVKVMKIVFFSNSLTGKWVNGESTDDDAEGYRVKGAGTAYEKDLLEIELGVDVYSVRETFLPYQDFYNEPLSDAIEMDKDFANYKGEMTGNIGKFSFMNYPFVLTAEIKTLGLYFDNRIRMYSERRLSIMQSVAGQISNPYLRLKVRRENIIQDALIELELISLENPNDLKKQLVVEFMNEQGIDQGGVSKEFFQLVIEEIFNPDYGMFLPLQNDSMWFSMHSFETDAQFTLIGIVLGLAIYNNVILAVNFPMVVYRKLMGRKGCFEDLQDWNSTIYSSLTQMLEYENEDLEDVFMQTFRVCTQDLFGTVTYHDLKENGEQISVTQQNKYEFVRLYTDFLLNKSIEKQFRAFHRGFQMVTDESPLALLFRPEEIELLVCGSKNFDFDELELATQYDGGYTNDSEIIKNFWSIVHSLNFDDKRKLLQFTTGSDRVPLGGLSKLKLVIARNGPDSDRLPTAHTCFNVLLMPEYASKEKLKDRLLKAINYSKGFGML